MRTVALPGTSLLSSRLGFGLSGLHHLLRSKDRQNLLASALNHGITYFDTSPYYGHGVAERELGTFARGRRSGILLATKFGMQHCDELRGVSTLSRTDATTAAVTPLQVSKARYAPCAPIMWIFSTSTNRPWTS